MGGTFEASPACTAGEVISLSVHNGLTGRGNTDDGLHWDAFYNHLGLVVTISEGGRGARFFMTLVTKDKFDIHSLMSEIIRDVASARPVERLD